MSGDVRGLRGRTAWRACLAAGSLATVALLSGCAQQPAVSVTYPAAVQDVPADVAPADALTLAPVPAAYATADTNRLMVALNRLSPHAASRVYAFTALAAVRAFNAVDPQYADAAAAYAASVVGKSIFTSHPSTVAEYDALALRYRGLNEDSLKVAAAVGADVAALADDGYLASNDPLEDPPVETAWDWEPTGNSRSSFEAARWGGMRPLSDVTSCDIPAPDLRLVEQEGREMLAGFTVEQAADPRVLTWLGGAGSPTPPGQWVQMTVTASRAKGASPEEALRAVAAVSIAGYDAGILVWREKAEHHLARPETMWRRWTGTAPLMLRETPPHPSYPSGHSGFAGAGAAVIEGVLGSVPVTLELPADNGVPAERHTFPSPAEAAAEASLSRVLSGFHYPEDTRQGEALGRCVGMAALTFVDAGAGA